MAESKEITYNPVRVVESSSTSLTGKVSSVKGNSSKSFESSLERDFIQRANFDPNVLSFVEQPLTIEFNKEERLSRYTPDFLVFYKNDNPDIPFLKPHLIEVKFRDNMKKNWKDLKPRFIAAMRYCDEMNWKFKILTEVEIRTDYLFNVKFLSQYKNTESVHPEDVSYLLDEVSKKGETSADELINGLANGDKRRNHLLFTLWYLVSNYLVGAELSKKLSMNTTIWSKI